MAFDPCSGQMVLFGGSSPNQELYEDTWVFNLTTKIWKKLNTTDIGPSGRTGAAIAFDPCNGLFFMFGGLLSNGFYNDTWVLNLKTESWEELSPPNRPLSRAGSAMVFDPRSGLMVLFGGLGLNKLYFQYYDDTWTFNTSAKTWTQLSASATPPAQAFSPMTFDPCLGEVVLYNQSSTDRPQNSVLQEVWTLNTRLNQWTKLKLSSSKPSNTRYGPMVFNPCTGQDILYRKANVFFADTGGISTFNALANAWKSLNSLTLPVENTFLMDFASCNGEMILYVSEGRNYGEVWTLGIGVPSDLEAVENSLLPVHSKGF